MMSKYLIEKDGEKQFVSSLKGYDDSWTIHGKGKKFEPKEHHVFERGKWVHQPEAQAQADRQRMLASLTNADLVKMIEGLADRVAKLEGLTS